MSVPLCLVEHDYQVDDLCARGLRPTAEWIALGPGAASRLSEHGIAHRLPDDFHDEAELRRVCEETHA
jgi:hypothetical protein